MLRNAFFAAAAAAGMVTSASAATLDFESGAPPELSGAGSIVSVGGLGGYNGFSGSMLQNTSASGAASVLAFSGLGAHTMLTIEFGLALIDSWDGTAISVAPDWFNLTLDGLEIFEISVEFAGPAATESIPATAGGRSTPGNVFGSGWADNLFDVSITVAHSASSAVLAMFADGTGWQGGSDESWAIDNLSVTTNGVAPVPLPAGGLLLLGGLGALMLGKRRKTA